MMMESFLSHLYDGHLAPFDKKSTNRNVLLFNEKAENLRKRLEESLSKDDFEIAKIYAHQFECIASIEKSEAFSHGFSMGVLLMFDVMNVKGELDEIE